MLLASGDETQEPGLVKAWSGGIFGASESSENGGQKDGDRLFRRRQGKDGVYGVTPELVTHTTDRGGRGYVGNTGEFEIEGADGEVGGAERRRQKCGEDVGRVVILPSVRVSIWFWMGKPGLDGRKTSLTSEGLHSSLLLGVLLLLTRHMLPGSCSRKT